MASPKMVSKRFSLLVNLRNFRVSFDREFRTTIRSQTRTSHLPLEEFEVGTRFNVLRQFESCRRTGRFSADRQLALYDLECGQLHALGRTERGKSAQDFE